jgi:hypothetical protein
MKYIEEVYVHGVALWRWKSEYRDYTQQQPPSYHHVKVVEEMHKELRWLADQFGPAKEKFSKYLVIGG